MNNLKLTSLILLASVNALTMQNIQAADLDPQDEHADHLGHDHSRPDSHAPIGVMGDHLMGKGEWMMSYRLMYMHMDGMRSGTDDISPDEVAVMPNPLAGETMRMGDMISTVPPTYRVVPLEMDMYMHMVGTMYGLTDDVTMTLMFSYLDYKMKSRTYQGMAGTTVIGDYTGKSEGLGDTKVSALIRLPSHGIHNFHLNAGVSLPTGSIKKSGSVLAPNGMELSIDRLGYNMQLGSGTVDLIPGITYTARKDNLSWGSQVLATLRLYDNSQDYHLGNVLEGTAWVANRWQDWVSTSARISAKTDSGIKGRDDVITGGSPVFDPDNSGGEVVNLLLGVNLLGTDGWLKNQRLALEVGMPVYENVDGIQMSQDWTATLGWQTTF